MKDIINIKDLHHGKKIHKKIAISMLQKSNLFEYATYSAWEKSYKIFFLVKTSLVCKMMQYVEKRQVHKAKNAP